MTLNEYVLKVIILLWFTQVGDRQVIIDHTNDIATEIDTCLQLQSSITF